MKDLADSRKGWIDFCRGIAMLTVIIDHTQMLYPKFVAQYTIFAVPMFVFLGGITSSMSLEKTKSPIFQYVWKRLKPIVFSYAIATAAYRIYTDGFDFSLSNYLSSLLLFNATSPFYFLAFYIQLVAISRPLYWCINKYDSIAFKVALMIILYLLSVYIINHVRILNLHGGGAYLLGGTFLLVFAMGMVCRKPIAAITSSPKKVVALFIASVAMLIIYERLDWIHVQMSNPPDLKAIFYTMIMTALTISSFHLAANNRTFLVEWAMLFIRTIGKHSLYIYLYHFLVILLIGSTNCYYTLTNDIERLAVQTLLPIGIPLCMAFTWQAISARLKTANVFSRS